MAKARQTKRRRVAKANTKSAEHTSNETEQTITNIGATQETANDTQHNESPPVESPEETVLGEDLPDPDADVVFQCASCRSIIGDTQSEYQAHLEFETLSLKAASNVSVQKDIQISKKGFDSGCTYRKVVCSECKSHLGRTYTSTTKELDILRSTYTFSHTALVSYQLGSSKTLDGQYAPNPERALEDRQQTLDSAPVERQNVSPEAFDELDAHVTTLTDATNKLTEAFNQNKDNIDDMKHTLEATNESLNELRAGLEHVQNMMLLWDERFQRLDACEQGIAKLATDCTRYDLCERRVTQLEEIIRNSNLAGTRVTAGHPQTASMKTLPPLRKSTSPARSSLKRRRQ